MISKTQYDVTFMADHKQDVSLQTDERQFNDERKDLQRRVAESEDFVRSTIDNIQGVVYHCKNDSEWTMEYLSQGCFALTGYRPEELVNNSKLSFRKIVLDQDNSDIMTSQNDVYEHEYKIRTKNGEVKWVLDRGKTICSEDGTGIRLEGILTDITAMKTFERELRELKEQLRLVTENISEVVWLQSPDQAKIIFVNPAFEEIWGMTCQDLYNNPMVLMETIYTEDQQRVAEAYEQYVHHKHFDMNYRIVRPDSQLRWVNVKSKEVRNSQGKIIGHVGSAIDITERKQAEIEAQHQAQRSQALLQITSRLNAELEPEKVKQIICGETCSALHVTMSAYLTYDKHGQALQLAASIGTPEELARGLTSLRWNELDPLIKRQGSVGVVPNKAGEQEFQLAQVMVNHGINWSAYALVERDGVPLGVLLAGDDDMTDNVEDSLNLLAGIANHAASALTNARLYQEAQNRLNQVQALRNIDMAITGSLDLRVTLQVVLDEVTNMLQTDAAAILRLNPHTGNLHYEHWRGFKTKDLNSVVVRLGEGCSGRIALSHKGIHIKDLVHNDQDFVLPSFMCHEGFVAYYGVPLIAKGTVLGVLEVFHREKLSSNGEWLAFLETLAGQAAIAVDNAELFLKLEHSNVNLLQAYDATIEGWAHALDLKDEETEEHSQRVTELTLHIARKLDIKDEDLVHIRRGALLHDIGKMGVPDNILLKPGELTDEEWAMMRQHPVYAFEMLAPIDYLRPALDIPYCHHEKWDGSGYPRGLKGKQIPLAARIFAVVDVFDALTSNRPYRKAWSIEKTLGLIREESGKHFDPEIVKVFIGMMEQNND